MKTQQNTPKQLKCYEYEIYTCNPQTGKRGWEIKNVAILAYDKDEARLNLQTVPNYDCVILWNNTSNASNEQIKKYNEGVAYEIL